MGMRSSTPHTAHAATRITAVALAVLCLLGAPLAGVLITGRKLAPYLEFPPATQYVEHPGFSWLVFGSILVPGVVFCLLFYWPSLWLHRAPKNWHAAVDTLATEVSGRRRSASRFRWWGWLGLILIAIWWPIAWTRPEFAEPVNRYTFTPLWLGLILVLDALVYWRKGHSMATRSLSGFLLLFAVSALTWWLFEYLNRFTQNWYYSATRTYSPAAYFWSATPCFSTVLPAVLEMTELYGTCNWLQRRYSAVVRLPPPGAKMKIVSLLFGVAGLMAAAAIPSVFYPCLWLSPLFVVVPLLSWARIETPFTWLARGDWRAAAALPVGALSCGFFWEMWNLYSLPKWHYDIPFVERFHIFEMPLPGYFGYLPFGWECYCAFALAFALLRLRLFQRLAPCHGLVRSADTETLNADC